MRLFFKASHAQSYSARVLPWRALPANVREEHLMNQRIATGAVIILAAVVAGLLVANLAVGF
jgi:hypothetical protein